MPRKLSYGLISHPVPLLERIAERAYYKWLNGSDDELRNWHEAVKEELTLFREMYE